MKLSAVILAGGESRRMGRDKAFLEIGGESLLARALRAVCNSGVEDIMISGRHGVDYSGVAAKVVLDREPGRGPISGIERALEISEADLLLVLAVDLPNMTSSFLRKLAEHCDPLTGRVPKLNGQLEPLAAIYPKRCRFIALDCVLKNRRAARDFADACLREQAVKTFPVSPADSGCFKNWNSPSDVSEIDQSGV